MIVFKTFLRVLNKFKFSILFFILMLAFFGSVNLNSNDNNLSFKESKPKVLVVNNDSKSKLSLNFVSYIKSNCRIVKVKENEVARSDALFYRDVNYIIYIPKNYGKDFRNGKNPQINIKTNNSIESSFAELLVKRYIKIANVYNNSNFSEDELIDNINKSLKNEVEIEKIGNKDENSISRATFYYNFMNYSILAGVVYVISLILSSFNEKNVRKRINVSSMDYRKHNIILLFGNILISFVLWLVCVILSFFLLGNVMFSMYGLFFILNSFIFMICSVSFAFIIGVLVNNREIISGIINVVALGSSFMCGSFVPVSLLPDFVLKFAHVLPSYWYINSNELIKNIDVFDVSNIKQLLFNFLILFLFTLLFIFIFNFITQKKRKISQYK